MTMTDTRPRPRRRLVVSRAQPDPARYGRLLAAAPATHRCPVLLTGRALRSLRRDRATAEEPHPDVAAVLGARWPRGCALHADCLAPFAAFPGLAPSTGGELLRPRDVVATAVEEVALRGGYLLGLVAVPRPADVPDAVGWARSGHRPGELTAVLRSWEDRFGAVLVRMSHDALELAVTAPPWAADECLAVAAEHYALGDDTFRTSPGTVRHYARSLSGARLWPFRWDRAVRASAVPGPALRSRVPAVT